MIIEYRVTFKSKISGDECKIRYSIPANVSYFDAWKKCIDMLEPDLVRMGHEWYVKSIEHML